MAILQKVLGSTLTAAATIYTSRFEAYTLQAAAVNREVLRQILFLNRDCDYGRRHNFSAIQTTGDYQRGVPITGYEDYEPYIARMAAGEKKFSRHCR